MGSIHSNTRSRPIENSDSEPRDGIAVGGGISSVDCRSAAPLHPGIEIGVVVRGLKQTPVLDWPS